jgi:hypothetical protein
LLKTKINVTHPSISRLLGQEVYSSIIKHLFINHQTINIMKKISLVVAAALLLSAGNVFATEGPSSIENPKAKICEQIESLLEASNGYNIGEAEELSALVSFMLNDEKEIIVLSVDTDDERLELFVKARLNYEKVTDQNLKEGKTYRIPIRVRA